MTSDAFPKQTWMLKWSTYVAYHVWSKLDTGVICGLPGLSDLGVDATKIEQKSAEKNVCETSSRNMSMLHGIHISILGLTQEKNRQCCPPKYWSKDIKPQRDVPDEMITITYNEWEKDLGDGENEVNTADEVSVQVDSSSGSLTITNP